MSWLRPRRLTNVQRRDVTGRRLPLSHEAGAQLFRCCEFSAAVIKGLHSLPTSSTAKKIEDQLVRSTMSVGANYEEARGADSRADFCNKLQISLKEMRETRYWLCLIQKTGMSDAVIMTPLVKEATELRAILAKAVATARGKGKTGTGLAAGLLKVLD
jgi:four helix bundle protein